MAEAEPALELRGVGMRFGTVTVLRDVDYQVERGAIHALVGHNGAGKSTLMKIALGGYAPTAGTVAIGGAPLPPGKPSEARRLGLGMVLQERSLIPTLSGLDNIFLGAERINPVTRLLRRRAELVEAERLCEELRIAPGVLRRQVGDMTPVEQQMVEIAKAVRLARSVLVLDEPTAPLSHREIDALFTVIRRVAEVGAGIVYISHHLSEVFAISDRVTCLREGQVSLSAPTAQTSLPEVIEAMLGRRQAFTEAAVHPPPDEGEEPVLRVEGLNVGEKFPGGLSFVLRPGEIVGLAGLAGSGRSSLLRGLFGDARRNAGTVTLRGKAYAPGAPWEAIQRGVYLIPEDRAIHGLVGAQSVAENIALPVLRDFTRFGVVRAGAADRLARDLMAKLDIRARGPAQMVGELSGGNQQKVVLAKALAADADVLLLDEPTFGVDIGAAAEVIRHVRTMVDAGKAVLWATSDLQELLTVADRVLVLGDGAIQRVVHRDDPEFTEPFLIQAMQRQGAAPAGPREQSA